MVFIRGRVEPGRANSAPGAFRSLFGAGRWDMEYEIRDRTGKRINGGTFKANPNGCFTLSLNTPTPGTVEIRVFGGSEYASDCCTVNVFADNDVINLPRRLNPLGTSDKNNRRLRSLH